MPNIKKLRFIEVNIVKPSKGSAENARSGLKADGWVCEEPKEFCKLWCFLAKKAIQPDSRGKAALVGA